MCFTYDSKFKTPIFLWLYIFVVAVRIGTGMDATHMGEEVKCPWGPNSSGGTKKSTRLTSKYVLWGKTDKVKL